jgi:hypothetical protein
VLQRAGRLSDAQAARLGSAHANSAQP